MSVDQYCFASTVSFWASSVVPCNGIQHWIAFTCKKIIADGPNRNSNQFLWMDFPKYANREIIKVPHN